MSPPTKPSDKYTAVIFVHGMGRQARHENVGRLLEALETHCSEAEVGRLRGFRARTEPSRRGDPDDVPFVQFDRFEVQNGHRWRFAARFRAYEAYWSPVTARGAPALRVAAWAFAQLAKPRQVAVESWRRFTHLRIARLHRLIAETPVPADPVEARGQAYVFASLLAHIQRFRGHEGARHQAASPGGAAGVSAFVDFVSRKLGAVWKDRIAAAVARWDAARLPVEDFAAALGGHIRLMGLAALVFLLAVVLHPGREADGVGALLVVVLAALAAVAVAVLAGRFLAFTFSDVFIWNSNQDHDRDYARRQDVLARTRALIEHVVSDPACKRLVLVSHSLGTAVTLETLCLIGRRNMAREGMEPVVELGKLSHLFTLGSPIDKIFYFFQTREAQTYRAGRLNDDLRGNLSQEPFFRDGRQRVDWLNVWDRADPVSDPLYAPLGNVVDGAHIRSARILNCEVENTATFSAARSHVGYLDNNDVVDSIAEALFRNTTRAPGLAARPLRDPALTKAWASMLRWTSPAVLAGAIAAAAGYGWPGLIVALAPAAGYAVTRWRVTRRRAL